jgi:L-ascorbate metabolism protein UlaG (beta-lactamase superfamily)
MDVPWIAAHTGCRAYGSQSLATLMGLHDLAAQASLVEFHKPIEIGPLVVRFVPSIHSMLLFGLKVPSDGEFTCDGLGASTYRCGQVHGIRIEVGGATLYHQGSANLVDDQIRDHGVDVFLCGIAGRVFTRRYVARVLARLEPRIIVPRHYDDFFRPLDARWDSR